MSGTLWNRNYIKVMAANLMLYFSFYLLTPLLPIYLHETFNAPNDVVGLILSGYSITALIVRPFSGFMVDSFPRKKVLVGSFLLFSLCFGGYLTAGTLLLFGLIRTLHGGPFGAVTVANSTAAIDVLPPDRRNEGIGLYGLSNNVAMAVAPSVGIFLYHQSHQFHLLFWLALLIAFVGLALDTSVKLPTKTLVRNNKKISLDRFFLVKAWLLAVNIAFFGFCFGVLSNYLAIYSQSELGITNGTGTYFALLSAGLFASRLQGRKALAQGRLTGHAAYGMLLSLVGYTLFVAIPGPLGYYGSALCIGWGNGHMYPAFLNMFINIAQHNERGTANSSILTSWDAGFGLGILLGGVVSRQWGYTAAFWMVTVSQALGVVLFFLGSRRFFLCRRRDDSNAC